MRRFRFEVPGYDGRPLTFPPDAGVGPSWSTGLGRDFVSTSVVAYAPSVDAIKSASNWPDAINIEDLGEQDIQFSERFKRPEWWNEGASELTEVSDD